MTSKPVQPGDKCWHATRYGSPKLITVRQVRDSGWYGHGGIGFFPHSFSELFDTEAEAWQGMLASAQGSVEQAKRQLRNAENSLKRLRKRMDAAAESVEVPNAK